jgi:hypothetical protein
MSTLPKAAPSRTAVQEFLAWNCATQIIYNGLRRKQPMGGGELARAEGQLSTPSLAFMTPKRRRRR